jgi:WD40 repeat protein
MLHESAFSPEGARRLPWAKSFCMSLSAVTVFALGVGVVFVPPEIERWSRHPLVSVRHCQRLEQGRTAVTLIKELQDQDRSHFNSRIMMHDFARGQSQDLSILTNHEPTCITVDSKRRQLFIADEQGSIYSQDLRIQTDFAVLVGRHINCKAHTLKCSDDGKTLISLDIRGVYVWDLDQWDLRWFQRDTPMTCIAVLPDSRSMICGQPFGQGTRLVEVDLYSAESTTIFTSEQLNWRYLAVSPDGQYLAAMAMEGEVLILRRGADGKSWQGRTIPELRTGQIEFIAAFSPESDRLVTRHSDGQRLVVWNLQQEQCVAELAGETSLLLGSEFLDDERLLSWGLDGRIRVWDLSQGLVTRRVTLPSFESSRS